MGKVLSQSITAWHLAGKQLESSTSQSGVWGESPAALLLGTGQDSPLLGPCSYSMSSAAGTAALLQASASPWVFKPSLADRTLILLALQLLL